MRPDLRLLAAHVTGGPFAENVRGNAAYLSACEGRSPPVAWAMALAAEVSWLAGAVACAATDHRWVDDSCAGPDSGNMDMHCERCGFTFHHVLY